MRIYLASRYTRRGELEGYAREIRAQGDEVTSRWHDGHQDQTDRTSEDRQRFGQEDLADLRRADLVVVFTGGSTRGGYHFESGMAFALETPVILVGPRENVFHELLDQFDDWEDAFNRIYLTRSLARLGVLVSA